MDLSYNNFQAGELSPKMKGRTDLIQYFQGCAVLEGFVVELTGGVTRRPGFEEIDHAYSHSYASRLLGFVQGTDKYVLEFSHLKMRVFHEGVIVTSGGSDYVLTTPWSVTEIPDLVFAPGGKALYHPDHDPYELVCHGDASWTLTAFAAGYGPFLDENETVAKVITPSDTTGSITLTAVGGTPFVKVGDGTSGGHVGALWKLTHEIDEATTGGTLYATGTSVDVTIKGDWELTLSGRWAATVKWQRSENDGGTWKDVRTYQRKTPSSATLKDKGTETEDNVKYRLSVTWIGTPDPPDAFLEKFFNIFYDSLKYEIRAQYGWQTGIVRITAVASTTSATATVLTTLGGTGATYRWAEGAWSPYQGYPACGTIHESRIYAARTARKPTGVWAGRPFKRREHARLFDIGSTIEADDAFARTIDLEDCHEIQWLASLWPLLIGADGSIIKGVGGTSDSPITPSDANFITQSGMGSASVQPIKISGNVVYAGRDGKSVYELEYSDDKKVYDPDPLTEYREHILGSGVIEWTLQQQPIPILWCVTSDGELVGMTRRNATRTKPELLAWHRHPMSGATVESVAVIPGATADEVWISVCRTVNSSTYRSIERMRSFDWGSEQRDCFFVDSGTKWDGGAAKTITAIGSPLPPPIRVRITAAAHGFTNGWTVKLAGVVGMTDVNGKVYTVADQTADTFNLKTRDGTAYINGTAFAPYVSGGTVERVTNTLTGLTHLAAETVSVLLDGQPATGAVTAAGVYTVGAADRHYHNTIIIGRPYKSVLLPMWPEVRTVAGSAQGKKKKITYVGVRLYRSAGGKIGTDATDAVPIDYQQPGDLANADRVLVTDDLIQDHPGGWQEHGDIYLETDEPLPMTITAILFGME